MHRTTSVLRWPGLISLFAIAACGARTELPGLDGQGGAAGQGGHGGAPLPCADGETTECGSDVGTCKRGLRTCVNGAFGPCAGDVGPTAELCDGEDNNCDGEIDDGFHLGEACDDSDNDLCMDSVITCEGCSKSPDTIETCNGTDDNCNGIVDADCDVGDCEPALVVTGSVPSSPNCIDFPVEKGSKGTLQYPCSGGAVTAQLGSVTFNGTVVGGVVSLDGVAFVNGPDGCLWKTSHHIEGVVNGGQLDYSYTEAVVKPDPNCWQPCTETGTIEIQWAKGP